MLSREELLESINTELQACDRANPSDAAGQFRRILEYNALKRHWEWVSESGDEQGVLEQIADSLQKNLAETRRNSGWKSCCSE